MKLKISVLVGLLILAGAGLWFWKEGWRNPWTFFFGGDTWAKTYGGPNNDEAKFILETPEGNYLVAGGTQSFGVGGEDAWILQLDAKGQVVWQKTYGGSDTEEAFSIQKTADPAGQGYIVGGRARGLGTGGMDAWVVKMDGRGQVAWQEVLGGADWDYAAIVRQTREGGYIAAGATGSSGAGYSDVWVLKLDARGQVVWQKTYGGTEWDYAASLVQTPEGGYLVGGGTQSFGAGLMDAWVLKLDANGQVAWQKTYGEKREDRAYAVIPASDHGYIVAGSTASFGAGGMDAWVFKLDEKGRVIWQKTYGGQQEDRAYDIKPVGKRGYLLAGETQSYGAGGVDVWVLKLDLNGRVEWQRVYGGDKVERAYSIQETAAGGYVLAGGTASFGAGKADAWVLKTDGKGIISRDCPFGQITLAPSSASAAKVTDTSVTPADSTATVTVTAVKPSPITVAVQTQCPPEKAK